MSRIILSRHNNGEHVVVGWDNPIRGAWWQEFATKEEVAAAIAWLEAHPDEDSEEAYRMEAMAEADVKNEGKMGLSIVDLRDSMPEELRHLVTDEVLGLLHEHSGDPNSGFLRQIDLTKKEVK